jgi:tRNA (guanine10-N2)-methyltransferase
VYFGL